MTQEQPTQYGDLSDYQMSKFQKNADAWAYNDTMAGFALAECGDSETSGYYALVNVTDPAETDRAAADAYMLELLDNLTATDRAYIVANPYAIVETHSSGAVYAEWFETEEAARAKYSAIEADIYNRCCECGNALTKENGDLDADGEPRFLNHWQEAPYCRKCAALAYVEPENDAAPEYEANDDDGAEMAARPATEEEEEEEDDRTVCDECGAVLGESYLYCDDCDLYLCTTHYATHNTAAH